MPEPPYREGYEFLGWYLGGEQWSFIGFPVTNDITLVAKWEEIGTSGLAYYPLPDGTYGVAAGTTQYLDEIIIPSTYNGKKVTQILQNAFKDATNLVSITIPASVTSVGTDAFAGCTNLQEVIAPAMVIPYIPKTNLQRFQKTVPYPAASKSHLCQADYLPGG